MWRTEPTWLDVHVTYFHRAVVVSPLLPQGLGDSAQSAIVTVLGEFWAIDQATPVPSAALADVLARLGINEGATRAALSRLSGRGVLDRTKTGRTTAYSLSEHVRRTIPAAQKLTMGFGTDDRDWDGEWTVVSYAIPEHHRERRTQVREWLRWLGFGPVRDGVWVAPHGSVELILSSLGELLPPEALIFRATRLRGEVRAEDVWPLDALRADYTDFIAEFSPHVRDLHDGRIPPADALPLAMRLLGRWRGFPTVDPDLPRAALPEDWPRPAAREAFVAVHDAALPLAAQFVRDIVARYDDAAADSVRAWTVATWLDALASVSLPEPPQTLDLLPRPPRRTVVAAPSIARGSSAPITETVGSVSPQELDQLYRPAPEFSIRDDVPRGEVTEFDLPSELAFPGTTRTIGVYVPAQYDGTRPACVFVALDGLEGFYSVPTAFDNLIAAGEMPVTIGIGLGWGTVESATGANPRLQRSLEFDGMTQRLARFLLEEVLPTVETRTTAGGVPIRLSADPDDRAAGGLSTGGIGAFTLAWERPDAFRRVCSGIGTFVGMRGGDRYPVLVRKTEPKPIRVFLQGGENDGLPGFLDDFGDWWLGNAELQRALAYAGYDVRHEFGKGMHSPRHMSAVFPDAMRWLWADWPEPVRRGETENTLLRAVLLAGEDWSEDPDAELAADPYAAESPGGGSRYEVDPSTGELWIERGDTRTRLDAGLEEPSGIAVSPDGLWLAVADRTTPSGLSYRIRGDGSVDARDRFYALHASDAGETGARGWVFDRQGVLYAATALGVQLLDRNGRARAILASPDRTALTGIEFDSGDPTVLRVRTAGGGTYRRRTAIGGLPPGAGPVELPDWSGS